MRALTASLVLAAAFAASAVPAHAQSPEQILADYTQDGGLEPCDYTPEDLRAALGAVTPNVRSYASDYPAALRNALRLRRSGGCEAPPAPTAAASPPAAPATVPASPGAAVPASAPTADDGTSAALIVAVALAAALLLGALLAVLVSRLGRGGGRLAPAHHALREAGWRAGGVWAEFRDWLSLGR